MAQIDAKHSGITTNNLESVLRRLKSPILLLSERYHEIPVFLCGRQPFLLISLPVLALG